ncbi:hypothetical protein, partial [Gilvimarinus japonicus]
LMGILSSPHPKTEEQKKQKVNNRQYLIMLPSGYNAAVRRTRCGALTCGKVSNANPQVGA